MDSYAQPTPLDRIGRIAGTLILLLIPFGFFSGLFVFESLTVPGDAAETARRIVASEGLFRLGIVSDSIIFLLEIPIIVMLYLLLKPVNQTLSLVAASARIAMTVVQGVNLVNLFLPLLLLSGADYLAAFQPDQLETLVLLFMEAHGVMVQIWGLFFGLHLLFLGYLIYRSGYLPRVVGGLVIFASLSYFVQGFGTILAPQHESLFAAIGFLSIVELALPFWLVIKGVREPPAAAS